jgi:hypothetical protein
LSLKRASYLRFIERLLTNIRQCLLSEGEREEKQKEFYDNIIRSIANCQQQGYSIEQTKEKLCEYIGYYRNAREVLFIAKNNSQEQTEAYNAFRDSLQKLGYQDRSGRFQSLIDWLIQILHLPFEHIPSKCSERIKSCTEADLLSVVTPCITLASGRAKSQWTSAK